MFKQCVILVKMEDNNNNNNKQLIIYNGFKIYQIFENDVSDLIVICRYF